MVVRIEAIAGFRGQIDSADERDAVVDHDRLLVVAVQRPFFRVQPELDPGVARQLLLHGAHITARRAEERQRRSCPREHADVDPLSELGEQVAKDERLSVAA